jgi:hypothetical protein
MYLMEMIANYEAETSVKRLLNSALQIGLAPTEADILLRFFKKLKGDFRLT